MEDGLDLVAHRQRFLGGEPPDHVRTVVGLHHRDGVRNVGRKVLAERAQVDDEAPHLTPRRHLDPLCVLVEAIRAARQRRPAQRRARIAPLDDEPALAGRGPVRRRERVVRVGRRHAATSGSVESTDAAAFTKPWLEQ